MYLSNYGIHDKLKIGPGQAVTVQRIIIQHAFEMKERLRLFRGMKIRQKAEKFLNFRNSKVRNAGIPDTGKSGKNHHVIPIWLVDPLGS